MVQASPVAGMTLQSGVRFCQTNTDKTSRLAVYRLPLLGFTHDTVALSMEWMLVAVFGSSQPCCHFSLLTFT